MQSRNEWKENEKENGGHHYKKNKFQGLFRKINDCD